MWFLHVLYVYVVYNSYLIIYVLFLSYDAGACLKELKE